MACLNCLARTPAKANFCPECGVKLVEGAFETARDRLSAMAEDTPDVLWSIEADGRLRYVSPSVERLLGYAAEDCVGHSVVDPTDLAPGITEQAAAICAAQIEVALSGRMQVALFEIELESAAGVLLPVEVNAVAVRSSDGTFDCVQGVVREVFTRERAAAAAAREAEVERLVAQIAASFINVPTQEIDSAIDSALAAVGLFTGVDSSAILLADPDTGDFVLHYGWNRENFVPAFDKGQRFKVDDLPWMHAKLLAGETVAAASVDDLPAEAERERLLMEHAGLHPLVVTPLVTAGRLCGYAALTTRGRLPEWTSQILGLLRFVGDVVVNAVERKQAAAAATQLEADLRQAQKMEAVGTLAGGIAHDFNNLLTSILGGIEFGLLDLPKGSEAADGLHVAQEAAERAAELTGRMLTLSRPQEIDMRATDLNAVVARTVDFLRRSIPPDIRIHVDTDATIPLIRADEGQLGQALLNLAINARDSMSGAGEIRIETRLRRAPAFGASEPRTEVTIVVADDGAGISDAALPHIFEPFFTTKSIGKGTGLGLSMAYGCARAHGGQLTVKSVEGQGSTFEIALPLAATTGSESSTPEAIVVEGHETILLVDDTDTVLQIACGMLERAGYDVVCARSCAQALERFDEQPGRISAVVTDLVMPGGSGRDLLKALRARCAALPIILTSGYLADTSREQIEAEGFACLLAKPFSRRTLALAVQQTLSEAGARAKVSPGA